MNPAKDIFKRADQAARKGNSEYAVELYLQGLTLDPKAHEERRKLHYIETQEIERSGGNPAGGMKAKLASAGTLAKIKKLRVQKRWDEVIVEIERAIRVQPKNVNLLYELGGVLEQLDDASEAAISTYQECIETDKNHVESYRKLGYLHAAVGDPKKAVEAWEKLRMHKPDDKEAGKAIRDLSAATLVDSIESKKASTGDETFRAMLKSEEESADLEQKAKVIRTDEDRVEAIRFKKEELRSEPSNSRLWRELGQLYQDLRKFKHARAAYKKALEVNAHDLFAVDKLGSLEEAIFVQKVQAVKDELAAVSQNGTDAAKIAEFEEKVAEADRQLLDFRIVEYDRKVKAHPTDYELKIMLGDFLLVAERYDEAIEQFQKAVKDPKLKVRAQNNMGKCFQEKKVYPIAIAQYTEALKGVADPDSDISKSIRYNLATANEDNGSYQASLEFYHGIMANDIGYRDVSARVDDLMKKLSGGGQDG